MTQSDFEALRSGIALLPTLKSQLANAKAFDHITIDCIPSTVITIIAALEAAASIPKPPISGVERSAILEEAAQCAENWEPVEKLLPLCDADANEAAMTGQWEARERIVDAIRALASPAPIEAGGSVVDRVAKALCEASNETWREGTYEALTGPNFTMETHPLDPLNNHWRMKARAALSAIPPATEEKRRDIDDAEEALEEYERYGGVSLRDFKKQINS